MGGSYGYGQIVEHMDRKPFNIFYKLRGQISIHLSFSQIASFQCRELGMRGVSKYCILSLCLKSITNLWAAHRLLYTILKIFFKALRANLETLIAFIAVHVHLIKDNEHRRP